MESTKNEFGDVIYKSKNKCGQTLNLTIQCYPYPKATHWNVVFWVGKHSKGLQHLKQTGKDGLSSLLWAKSCIIDFINVVERKDKPQYLCVRWDDNRRRDAYMYRLKDLGFDIKRIEGKLCLCKTL